MTKQEFLSTLAQHATKFTWYATYYGTIRATSKAERRDKANVLVEHFCPITAVCAALHRGVYYPSEYRDAATALGMSREVAGQIIRAADVGKDNTELHQELLSAIAVEDVYMD